MVKRIQELILKSPYLIFAPFLILYIALVIIFPTDGMSGDEGRYLIYAHYMLTGKLPLNEINIDILGNGPGYSIILIPFVALHIPVIWIALMNCFFYYFSIILLFKALSKIVSFRKTILLSLFWACYYNLYENMLSVLPETFTALLICLLIYYLFKGFQKENSGKQKKYMLICGLILGYIELTKPIFGYVLLILLFGLLVLWLLKRRNVNYKKGLLICIVALLVTTPYLIYTYTVTGKIYYWSTFGGNNLYWMTTPFAGEYGNWMADPKPNADSISQQYHYNQFEKYIKSNRNEPFLSDYYTYLNHKKDFELINKVSGVARDDLYKKISINNIKEHPIKFLQNCISNTGRIFFNYPYSYNFQTPGTLLRLPLNGTILVMMIICTFPTLRNWRQTFFPIKLIFLFGLFYLGGSIIASAETRMFTIIVPIFLVWIAYVVQKSFKVQLDWKNE